VHLIEENRARLALDEASMKWEGALLAWEIATWAVMRDPSLGEYASESGKTRALTSRGAKSRKMPDLTILYVVDGDTIVIHDALFEEPRYGQAGTA
jgi:hypothetical protein